MAGVDEDTARSIGSSAVSSSCTPGIYCAGERVAFSEIPIASAFREALTKIGSTCNFVKVFGRQNLQGDVIHRLTRFHWQPDEIENGL
jgi:hypothetical protein